MPPKKDKKQDGKGKTNKSKTDVNEKDGKRKKKILGKGEGMGGTIGLAEKNEKKCILPCVKSFSQPPACCPQELRCPVPVCCPPTPVCPRTTCPGSTLCCYMP